MSSLSYQGLFYLAAGSSVFILLTLVLRTVSDLLLNKKLPGEKVGSDTSWLTKEPLEIIGINNESRDIKTFSFIRKMKKDFPTFQAGQFLSFEIDNDPKILRSYSISSSICNRSVIQVSVKILKGGIGSTWFHGLHVGDVVVAHPPSGLFVDPQVDDSTKILIAGGIGITPLLSMIRSNLDLFINCRLILFYGMKTEDDLAFHNFLEFLSNEHENFSYYPILSQSKGAWTGDVGRVTIEYIKEKIQLGKGAYYLMCGPEAMTSALQDSLLALGVPLDQVHYEKFASPHTFDVASLPERTLTISYNGDKTHYAGRCTLLESLETNGISHPFACRVGVCGACKCKIDGEVVAATDAGLTTKEKQDGFYLACVTYPCEDIDVRRN